MSHRDGDGRGRGRGPYRLLVLLELSVPVKRGFCTPGCHPRNGGSHALAGLGVVYVRRDAQPVVDVTPPACIGPP